MSERLPIFAVIGAIIVAILYGSMFVVSERQQAVVLRFGQIVSVKKEPGLYFKLPFGFADADNVEIIEDRVMRFNLENIRAQVSSGKFFIVDAFVAYRIEDAKKFVQSVSGSVDQATKLLRTRLNAALRQVYGLRGFSAALSKERAEMMQEVAKLLRPDAESLGITIVDVRIRSTDLTPEVSQQTYDRMKAERLAEAERLRARGREAASRIKAGADREVVETIAKAERESLTLRGEGEGERAKILAEAHSQGFDFFSFKRSLEAYVKSFKGKALIYSNESEFFRYLGNESGGEDPVKVAPMALKAANENKPALEEQTASPAQGDKPAAVPVQSNTAQ